MSAALAAAEKRCPKCGQTKPMADFSRDRSKASGISARCKLCLAEDQRAIQHAHKTATGIYLSRTYTYERTCEQCGETWTSMDSRSRFCSNRCSNKARRWRHECRMCGIAWESGRADSSYCSDECRVLAAKTAHSQVALRDPAIPAQARAVIGPRPLRKRWYAGRCACCDEWFIHDQPATRTCSPRCARKLSRLERRAVAKAAFVARVSPRKIFERDGWKCRLCGKPVERDAVVPHPLAPTVDHIVPYRPRTGPKGTHEPANVQCAHFRCNTRKNNRGGGEQLLLIG